MKETFFRRGRNVAPQLRRIGLRGRLSAFFPAARVTWRRSFACSAPISAARGQALSFSGKHGSISCAPFMEGDEDAAAAVELSLGLSVGAVSTVPAFTRREYHAFCRREARRKQEQKHMRKAKAHAAASAGDHWMEDSSGSQGRFVPAPISVRNPNASTAVGYAAAAAAAAIPVVPLHCAAAAWQYVPCGGRLYALPCMLPCWPEGVAGLAVDSERRVAGLPPATAGVPVVGKEVSAENVSGKGRSNSASSKETKSESNLTHATANSPKLPQQPTAIPRRFSPPSKSHKKNVSSIKLLAPKPEPEEATFYEKKQKRSDENENNAKKMPCVMARGDGPEGKAITGFLYRYDNVEIRIMCVCHGDSFSPAEFLRHAGSSEISHPLRHIVVLPSPES